MSTPLKKSLDEIYRRYGFQISRRYEQENILVFTLKTGYFDNADIVPLAPDADPNKAFQEFTKAGFACIARKFLPPDEAEKQLFKGFFSVDAILARLQNDYARFTKSIVAPFSENARYEYINAPYQVNGTTGSLTPADEVVSRLNTDKPTLFLIEAAAGFGKTCTAYELVNLLTKRGEYLPLFSELARNRQAVIFRHILLDEIDRTFPTLGSQLVQAEMKNGRVITILDGFDELLRKSEDGGDFENSEPMLETIGEFLVGHAKIVLTTRRTVLFEGDAFHKWAEQHAEEFDLVRLKISEPQVANWLPATRYADITKAGLRIEDIANPVLLSYLRCIPDDEFLEVVAHAHMLVEKYFDFMLDRERTRQDLRLDATQQQQVLRSIAQDMLEFGYTSEQRDYIVDHIQRVNSRLLEDALLQYPTSQRPTKEEIANKLASHALLDRSARETNKIGFVNEFVFGHFIAQNILGADDWLNDDLRFLEPAVISYQPRSSEAKNALWEKLKPSVEFLAISDRLDVTMRLRGEIDFALSNDEASGLDFVGITIGGHQISRFQFNECAFRDCIVNPTNLSDVTFLNCRYYGNRVEEGHSLGPIYVLGGVGDQSFIDALAASNAAPLEPIQPDRQLLLERFILEKFWPAGRPTVTHKHRPIQGVCANSGSFRPHELYDAIDTLKKKGILLAPAYAGFLEINFEEMIKIREILGRQGQ